MKRILSLIVVSILALSGFGATATSDDVESLNTQEDWDLLFKFKGGLFGYTLLVENIGNESVVGNISIQITTLIRTQTTSLVH